MTKDILVRDKVVNLIKEAKYRFGDDIVRILEWLSKKAKRAYQLSDSSFDTKHKSVYRQLGDALVSFVTDTEELSERRRQAA